MKNEVSVRVGKNTQVGNQVKTIVDSQTGEVITQEVEKVFTSVVKTDNFFMCFFENMAGFYGLKQVGDIKLLTALCEMAEYNTGEVMINTYTRKKLASRASISLSNISKNFNRLIKADLITLEEGRCVINPAVFWKGSTQERIELVKSGELSFKIRFIEALSPTDYKTSIKK